MKKALQSQLYNVNFIFTPPLNIFTEKSQSSKRSTALLRPPMEIKHLFFHFKTSYNKMDVSVFNLTDI